MTNSAPSMPEISVSPIAATNAVSSALVLSDTTGTSSPPGRGMSWTTPVAVIAVVGLILLAAKKLKKSLADFEKSVKDELIEDVLNAVAKDAPNMATLRAELVAAVSGSGSLHTDPLRSILRIEESYEKLSSGKYLRRVSILRQKEGVTGTGSLTKIESELGWEYVPAYIRDQFIAMRESKVVRLVYDAKGDRSV